MWIWKFWKLTIDHLIEVEVEEIYVFVFKVKARSEKTGGSEYGTEGKSLVAMFNIHIHQQNCGMI